MADVMRLTCSEPDEGTFDFLGSGTALLLDTLRTTLAEGQAIETFQIAFTGADATILANVEKLLRFKQRVEDYAQNNVRHWSVRLEMYGNAESAKGALVNGMEAVPMSEMAFTPLLGQRALIYQVSLFRNREWESASLTTISETGISAFGGKKVVNPGTTFYGSTPARISRLLLNSGPATTLYRIWLGIQPYYERGSTGGASYTYVNSYFDATWEAEVGTAVLGSFVNDVSASPAGTSSNTLEVTSVPATLGRAWWSRLVNHEATYPGIYLGEWYVLGRIKVDAGAVGVQRRYGVGSAAAASHEKQAGEIVYVNNTAWKLIDLGKVTFP